MGSIRDCQSPLLSLASSGPAGEFLSSSRHSEGWCLAGCVCVCVSKDSPTHDLLGDLGQVPAPLQASVSPSEQLLGSLKALLLAYFCLPVALKLPNNN